MHIFPLIYVLTGSINVLVVKWSDTMQSECKDGKWRSFQHPLLQTALMFLGEFLCFVVYKIVYFFLQRRGDGSENLNIVTRGGREFSPMSMLLPAFFDTIASLMLFSGLYLTYASSFQMLRSTALIFVGIFGSIYLNQTLIVRHWTAILTMICGVIIVVSSDVQRTLDDHASLPNSDSNSALTGSLFIICAQIFHAMQFVYEEKHLKGGDIPAMQASGWQGIFGLALTAVLAVCTNFLPSSAPFNSNSRGVFDDLNDIASQIQSNPMLLLALGIFIVSCALYNYTALSIVKLSSAANRILADGLRVIFIWCISLFLEWELLNFLTIIGFIILELGVIAYRNAIFIEWYRSLLAHLARSRYRDLSADTSNEAAVPTNRPADVI